jgi:two-component system KDP operon response regulator KdpE
MTEPRLALRILVVIDDKTARHSLRRGLTLDGYLVSTCKHGTAALDAVWRRETDLVLLGLDLPDVNGLDVIWRVRYARSDLPIIAMSLRDDEASKVAALDAGADDYLTRPFGMRELLARIRAVRRRMEHRADWTVEAGEITLDPRTRIATVRGRNVSLSPREHALLTLLATHAGKVLSHRFILRQVWCEQTDIQYLRIYVRSLRRKIELDPERPALIVTEPGVGYQLKISP